MEVRMYQFRPPSKKTTKQISRNLSMLKHTTTYLVYINIARKYLLHKAFQLQRVKENFRKHQKAPGCHGSSSSASSSFTVEGKLKNYIS